MIFKDRFKSEHGRPSGALVHHFLDPWCIHKAQIATQVVVADLETATEYVRIERHRRRKAHASQSSNYFYNVLDTEKRWLPIEDSVRLRDA